MSKPSTAQISRLLAHTWIATRGAVAARRRNPSWLGLERLEGRCLFNTAPVITTGTLAVTGGTLLEGTTQATLSGQFTDVDSGQTHTVSVDWGDGNVTAVPAAGGSVTEPTSHLSVRVDYSYDTNNFFSTQAKKDLFQQAIDSVVSHFTDNLSAIIPSGGNTWTEAFANPANGTTVNVSNATVNANEIVVYAGGYGLTAGELAYGGPGGVGASGSAGWLTTVTTRGQGTTTGAGATDFGPWGGMVVFNTSANFYFGSSLAGITSGQSDFYSVAVHEFSHLLGFGTAPSWTSLVSGSNFTGAQSVAEHGGNVPLSPDLGHWADGTTSGGQEAVMDPTLTAGTRKTMTALDYAGLDDVGWNYVAAPGVGSFSATHTYSDNGSYVVSVVLSDGSATATGATSATVTNVAPTLTISTAGAVNEGSTLTLNLAHTDPGTDTITRWNVNWGDGNIEQFNSNPASVTHTYVDPGTFSISATATDEDGTFSSNTLSQTINNVAPTLTTISHLGAATEDTAFTISYATLLAASNAADAGGGTVSFRVESLSSGTLTKNGVAVSAGTLFSTGESLVWTPAADANGSLGAFTVKAWDGQAASASAVAVNVDVTAVNDPPSFVGGGNQIVNEDAGAQTIVGWATSISAGPSDESAQTLAFSLTNDNNALFSVQPAILPDGTLSYTLNPDANGSATVNVQFQDNGGGSDTAGLSFTITVNPVNDAPTLTTISTLSGASEDTPFTITYATLAAAANEADIDSATLSFRVESTSSGTLTKNGVTVSAGTLFSTGESLVWTPAADANGTLAAFTVKAWDGQAASASAIAVNVDVAAVNDAPTLTSISTISGATEDTPFTITFATLTAAANEADIDSATLSFRVESTSSGTLTKNGSSVSAGTLFSSGESLIWTPAADANGTLAAFTVKAWDGQAASSSAIAVNISAAAVNDAPTLTAINTLSGASEDTPFTITYAALAAAANEADVDNATLSFSVESTSSGTLTKNGVAVIAGTLFSTGESMVWTPAADANGTLAAFTVKAWDGQAASTSAIAVNISAAAVNDAPTLTAINTLSSASEDTPFAITYATLAAAANEADIDSATLSFRVESTSSGTLTKNGSSVSAGTLFSTGESLVWTPAADANGTLAAFTVKAWDGQAASASAVAVNVDVAPVNDAPTLTAINTLSGASEDTPFTITYAALTAAANEADIDSATLSFRVESTSSGTLTKNGVAVSAGTLFSTGESLVWTPAADANGTLAAFTVKAWDGQAASVSAIAVNVDVAAVNDAPTLTAINTLSGASEDTPFTITYATLAAAANEADIDSATLSFRVESTSSGTLTKNGVAVSAGTLFSAGESLIWTPAADANGTLAAFTVKAWDGQAASASAIAVNVNVAAINDTPSFSAGGNQVVSEDAAPQTIVAWAAAISAGPNDESAQTLAFIVTNDNHALFSAQPSILPDGTLSYSLNPDANGVANVGVSLQDSGGGADTSAVQTFTITVGPVNDAPTLTSINTLSGATEDTPFTITYATLAAAANEADIDSATLSFRVESTSSGTLTKNGVAVSAGTLFSTGESLIWTPAADANGTLVGFTVKAWDGQAASASAVNVNIDAAAVNDAPTFNKGANQTVLQDAPAQTIAGWAAAISPGAGDESAQVLSFIVTNDNHALFAVQPAISSEGALTYTLAPEAFGGANVTVALRDDGGISNNGQDTSADQTFTVAVIPAEPTVTFTAASKAFTVAGTNLKLTLKGNGSGRAWAGDDGSIRRIELTGTDAKSSLTIAAIDKNGVARVDQIVVGDPSDGSDHTDLGTLSGKGINLGDSLTITGGVKSVTLANAADQHVIAIGSSLSIASATFKFSTLTDVTFTSATPIKTFTAAAWNDSDDNDTLTAPWIGSLTIKGAMQADVTVNSLNTKGVAITTYSAGTVGHSDGSDETDITVQSAGGIKTIKAAAWYHGAITAPWIGSFTDKGDMRADVVVTAADAKGVGITTYSAGIVGDDTDLTLQAGGGIKTIKVADWLGGTITAGYVGSVTSSGNFGASFDLSDAAQKNTLSKLTVKGAVTNITLKSAGNIGTVSVGSSTGSTFLAGVTSVPDSPDDFAAGDFAIAGFTSKGAFSASSLAASRILKVSLASVDTDNNGNPFGLYATAAPKSYKRLDTPGVKLLPLVSAPADLDPDTGDDFGVFVL